jgi:molybdenum cofactor biosynthesis enzyme MoaA
MIEIKGFLETSFLDWPGKLCSVFFLPYCNFRCPYCHNHTLIFHPEQYATIPLTDIFNRLHSLKDWIDGVCITGGEPLIRNDIVELIESISRISGIEDLSLTTNGMLLAKYAKDLKAAGMARINISLDTLDERRFSYITRVELLRSYSMYFTILLCDN